MRIIIETKNIHTQKIIKINLFAFVWNFQISMNSRSRMSLFSECTNHKSRSSRMSKHCICWLVDGIIKTRASCMLTDKNITKSEKEAAARNASANNSVIE